MTGNTDTLTRGNKRYELCNHLGNVLLTVQDRKQSKDYDNDKQADYYVAYLRTVTDYYAFGSAMPGIGGSVPKCTVTQTQTTQTVVDVNEDFNSGGTGGFTAGSGARTVSNPVGTQLHLESIWSTRPLANRTVSLVNGRVYTLDFDVVGFSVVSGYTHTVKVRILLPGATQTYTYTTTGSKSITFTSNTTGNVTIEISSQITGSGTYSTNPYIDIDNFVLSWEDLVTVSVNSCGLSLNYKYGFITQERENDLYGEGNSYSAEFWQYDGRIGRRWNCDPIVKLFEGTYTCFSNNPIYYFDIKGNDKDSRHLDPSGKIIAEYDDGDNSVYKHQTAKTKSDVDYWRNHFNNTSGNGIKVGEMNMFFTDGVFSINPSRVYYSTGFISRTSSPNIQYGFNTDIKYYVNSTNATIKHTKTSVTTVNDNLQMPVFTFNLEAWAGIKLRTKIVDGVAGTGTPILGVKENDVFILGNNLNSGQVEKYDKYGFEIKNMNYGSSINTTINYMRSNNKWVETSSEVETTFMGFLVWTNKKYSNGDIEDVWSYNIFSYSIGFGLAANGEIKIPFYSTITRNQ